MRTQVLFALILAIMLFACNESTTSTNDPDGDEDSVEMEAELDYEFEAESDGDAELELDTDTSENHDAESDGEIDTGENDNENSEDESDLPDGDLENDLDYENEKEEETEAEPDIDFTEIDKNEIEEETEPEVEKEIEPEVDEEEVIVCPEACLENKCGVWVDECDVEHYCGECDFENSFYCEENHECTSCPEGSEAVMWDSGYDIRSVFTCMYTDCLDTSDMEIQPTCENGWYTIEGVDSWRNLCPSGTHICFEYSMNNACEKGRLDAPADMEYDQFSFVGAFDQHWYQDHPVCYGMNYLTCDTWQASGFGLCCDETPCKYRCCNDLTNYP